jgi:RNA polymerase sigma-70 factor (ECF subfamily)
MKNFSEEQIWKAFKDGSDEALSFIYYQYAPKLYNYGRQFCAEDQVKDAIQDLFCEMIQSRGRQEIQLRLSFTYMRV